MSTRITRYGAVCATAASLLVIGWAQTPAARPQRDAVAEAQQPSQVKATRPEQQKNAHDNADGFNPERRALLTRVSDAAEAGQDLRVSILPGIR